MCFTYIVLFLIVAFETYIKIISLDSVATYLRCDGIFIDSVTQIFSCFCAKSVCHFWPTLHNNRAADKQAPLNTDSDRHTQYNTQTNKKPILNDAL